MNDNVIQFAPRGPRVLIAFKRKPVLCEHVLVVNEHSQSISCENCGKAMEPFEALAYMAADWDRFAQQLQWLERRKSELSGELEDLKRQIRNAKAQLQRATR
jgi:hypothetical protein